MRASGQQIVARIAKPPTMEIALVRRISGPWWDSSVTEKRSFVIRLMRTPVRFLSKNEKLRVCMCVRMSVRMSASIRTPILWP